MFITRQYTTLFTLLFITAATYLGVTAFYKGVTGQMAYEDVMPAAIQPKAGRAEAAVRPLADYAAINQRNLFRTGEAAKPKEAAPPPPEITKLEETKLKLKLWGTVTGDEEKAYAVIEDPQKRKQDLFRKGDSIQGALVKEILREKIILAVNGKDEILSMEKVESSGRPVAQSAAPSPFQVAASPPAGGSEQVQIAKTQIDDAMNNINSLMRQARIRPHFTNGKPDGLTLSRIQRDSLFTKLGLRSGDIITGVDGQQIESVDDALKFYNSLKSASNVMVEIRRRGQTKQIQYNIEQ